MSTIEEVGGTAFVVAERSSIAAVPPRHRSSSITRSARSPRRNNARGQNSTCTRTPNVRGGANAVPENKPAKLMTFRRSVRLTTFA
jgi:hypothetical protein